MVVFVSSTSLCFLQHSWQQITKMLKNTSNGFFLCKSGQKHTWLSSIIAHPGGHFFVCVRCENHLLWMMVFVVLHLIADKNLLLVVVESHSWKVSSV